MKLHDRLVSITFPFHRHPQQAASFIATINEWHALVITNKNRSPLIPKRNTHWIPKKIGRNDNYHKIHKPEFFMANNKKVNHYFLSPIIIYSITLRIVPYLPSKNPHISIVTEQTKYDDYYFKWTTTLTPVWEPSSSKEIVQHHEWPNNKR